MGSCISTTVKDYTDPSQKINILKDKDVYKVRKSFEQLNLEYRNSEKFKNNLTNMLPDISSVKLLELFFEYGANPNGNSMGCPVLLASCLIYSISEKDKKNHIKLIETFLKNGADPYTKHPTTGQSVIDNCTENQYLAYQLEAFKNYKL